MGGPSWEWLRRGYGMRDGRCETGCGHRAEQKAFCANGKGTKKGMLLSAIVIIIIIIIRPEE